VNEAVDFRWRNLPQGYLKDTGWSADWEC